MHGLRKSTTEFLLSIHNHTVHIIDALQFQQFL